ncbi:MAG: hypothetical protein CMH65_13950 [Nevskiales bacterium]|nr:hypothetical protein [Nevskiales bacterium]
MIRHGLLGCGLALTIGLAGCSGSEGETTDSTPLPVADDPAVDIDPLLGGEPLDQLQVTLDQLLIDGLSTRLPDAAGRELVTAVSLAVITLLDAPDELLEALLAAGDFVSAGEADPAVFQTLLADAGAEVFVHTRDTVALLIAGLQSLAPEAGQTQAALAALSELDAWLADPAAISDVSALTAQLRRVAQELASMDTQAFELSPEARQGLATALAVLTPTLTQTAGMIDGFSDPATGFPDTAMLGSVENILLGLLNILPLLSATLEDLANGELDLAALISDLADELDVLLADQGVLPLVVDVLYTVLVAVLTPVTGGLSALLCGLLPLCD